MSKLFLRRFKAREYYSHNQDPEWEQMRLRSKYVMHRLCDTLELFDVSTFHLLTISCCIVMCLMQFDLSFNVPKHTPTGQVSVLKLMYCVCY